jgi:hypothetical protein
VLVDGDEVVGFVSAILSERTIRGEKVRLYNTSSWIVKHEYRAHSLVLQAKVTADKGVAVTNLSATPRVLQLPEKQGFTLMDKSERIIFPVLTLEALKDSCEVLTSASAVRRALQGESLRFYRDHQLSHNHHVLLRTPVGNCYLLMNRTFKTVCTVTRTAYAELLTQHRIAEDVS